MRLPAQCSRGVARSPGVWLLTAALLTSCGEGPADRASAERRVQEAPSPRPAAEPGPLAARTEAQDSFDAARAALVREDYRTSATHLAKAAAFMRSHAAAAEIGAIAALQGSAKELEVLSERLARGEAQTPRTFDRVSANANRAEAQHHLTRSVAALGARQYRGAGEELIMTVDHLERAGHDLRRPEDTEVTAALGDARALAERMVQGGVPTRTEAKRVTARMMSQLRTLCGIIDVEARACAVEAPR